MQPIPEASPAADRKFAAAVVEVLPTLRNYALYLCGDNTAADDLIQDVGRDDRSPSA